MVYIHVDAVWEVRLLGWRLAKRCSCWQMGSQYLWFTTDINNGERTLIRGVINSGDWGSWPPDFGQEGSQGGRWGEVVDGSWTGREILLYLYSYYVQDVCSTVVTFEEKLHTLPRSSCKWAIFAWKIDFFKFPEKKSKFFKEFAWKIWNLSKMCM